MRQRGLGGSWVGGDILKMRRDDSYQWKKIVNEYENALEPVRETVDEKGNLGSCTYQLLPNVVLPFSSARRRYCAALYCEA